VTPLPDFPKSLTIRAFITIHYSKYHGHPHTDWNVKWPNLARDSVEWIWKLFMLTTSSPGGDIQGSRPKWYKIIWNWDQALVQEGATDNRAVSIQEPTPNEHSILWHTPSDRPSWFVHLVAKLTYILGSPVKLPCFSCCRR